MSSYNHNTPLEPQCSTYYRKCTNKAHQVGQSFQGTILQQKASRNISTTKPIVETSPSYIKDTTQFLKVIHGPKEMPKDTILATIDIKSLYNNIPHQEGMQYCLEAIENHYKPKTPLSLKYLHQMLKFVLENNYFIFDDKFYLQVHRTSMGTPNYANIFMTKIENQILHSVGHHKTPLLWKRFIDGKFKIWPHNEIELLQFLVK